MAADRGVMEGRDGSGLEEDDDFCGIRDTASESELSLEGWAAGTFGTGAPAGIIAAAHVGMIVDSVREYHVTRGEMQLRPTLFFDSVWGRMESPGWGGTAPNSGLLSVRSVYRRVAFSWRR